jgi:archaellum component FlaC
VSTRVLEDIREELKEIKLLYKELVEKLIPVEEPTKEEKKALREKDEIANEEELMKTRLNPVST